MHAPIDALMIDLYKRPRSLPWLRILMILVSSGNWKAVTLIRLSQHFHRQGRVRLRHWATRALRREFGCYVQPTAEIGPGLSLPHPNGIVIGNGVKIGASCIIYHHVTLGGARRGDFEKDVYPKIGDRVVMYAGAKVLGAVEVEDDAVIGANAVVLRDVPAWHSAVGIPARVQRIGNGSNREEVPV